MAASQLETWIREAKASTAAPAAPPHGLYLVRVEYAAIHFDVGEQQ
jgi:tRNA U38,U39,U40 pseudouridine synthase TruA